MLRLIVMCLAVALACTNSFAAKSGAKSKPAKASSAKSKPAKTASKSKALEFKDPRDKQTYRLVKIGDRTWFGDNLNFKSEGSFCLDDDDKPCYGVITGEQDYARLKEKIDAAYESFLEGDR